jgi:prokaryotic ubiquitin-like protein Pup
MATQTRIPKPQKRDEKGRFVKEEAPQQSAQAKEDAQALKDELDALMDEIDSVLEENAQEFVAAYIQKGGE